MKTFLFKVSLLLFLIPQSFAQAAPDVFAASTPCSKGTRPLPAMDTGTDCELMKWKLTLYKDIFELHCDYGMTQQNTKGFSKMRSLDLSGNWSIIKDGNKIIYQLHDNKSGKKISFIKLGDSLLHLLDADLQLMTGNAGWSYTFSKIK